jgi:hypothetical protein
MIANPRRDCCAQDGTAAATIAVSESVAWEVVRCGIGGGCDGNARATKIMCGDGAVVVVVDVWYQKVR